MITPSFGRLATAMGMRQSDDNDENATGDDLPPRHGRGRRSDDHPDWRQVMPRWLLVIIAAAFAVFVATSVRSYVKKVANLEDDMEVVKRRTAGFECGLLETRIDVLVYQEYMARRNKDESFADDLKKRKDAATNLLGHRRQTRECEGN